jgi:carboxyl-terminal processing protease
MEGGKSALKLTTASYHRPNGKNIHRFPDSKEEDDWGVRPNEGFAVKFSNEDLIRYDTYRRQRDDIRAPEGPKIEFTDSQLSKALEYISVKLGVAPPAPPAAAEAKPAEAQPTETKVDKSNP